MKSRAAGSSTSVEVTNISPHGLWLYWNGREFFLSFEHFPWFKEARISQVLGVEEVSDDHLHWPDLDVDLSLDSIEDPQKYPLVSKRRV